MKKRKEWRTVECKHCSNDFKTRHDDKVFCNAKCKHAWHYKNMRDAVNKKLETIHG